MECKDLKAAGLNPALSRFNRYIVECKDIWQKGYVIVGSGFNRYIVECKVINGNGATTASGDLIDTLWNVKEDQSFKN